jgi:TorA maturation chaperone TorD
MNARNIPETSAEASVMDGPEELTARSVVYAVLARGFSQPDQDVEEFFRLCGEVAPGDNCQVVHLTGEVVALARSATLEELQAGHMHLFHPVNGPFPYETEHRKGHEFAKAQVLADIMGFYRAFGVYPQSDRADNIVAELEFMHLLTLKEAHAAGAGEADNASLCRDARRKFFTEHVSSWSQPLLEALRAGSNENTHPFYKHLIDLYEVFMESEKENFA